MKIFKKLFVSLISFIVSKLPAFILKQGVKKRPRKRRKPRNIENVATQFRTLKDLLSNLDGAFANLKLLRPKRQPTQQVVKKYGPYIIGDVSTELEDEIDTKKLTSHKAYGLPTFLCFWWEKQRAGANADKYMDWFFVATKFDKLKLIRPEKGFDYYMVSLVYMPHNKPFEIGFDVAVERATGTVKAMPMLTNTRVVFPRRYKQCSRTYTTHSWEYPNIDDIDINPTRIERKKYLAGLFCIGFELTMRRELTVNIRVKKGGNLATFSVPQNEWKYFFKDRIEAKTPSGAKKRIYHAVASHHRKTLTGISPVKTHYRGNRHFYWEGYEILIVHPEKHGRAQASLTPIGCGDTEGIDESKLIDMTGPRADQINSMFDSFGEDIGTPYTPPKKGAYDNSNHRHNYPPH